MVKVSLNALFPAIAKVQKLYVPDGSQTSGMELHKPFKEWKADKDAPCEKVRTPKDFFFPQTENLMDFKREGKTIEVIDTRSETEDFVIFGVRACDVRSFAILDKVFLVDPIDT